MPLAAWLTFLLTVVTLLVNFYQQQTAPKTITPDQVEEIITRVIEEVEEEPAPDPAPDEPKSKSKAPRDRNEPRSGR
jgi:hypothetical protein